MDFKRSNQNNFDFVNDIRFWSMFAIVLEHCALLIFPTDHYNSLSILLVALIVQLCKFGTIAFFIISGFLLGRMSINDKWGYFSRRVQAIGTPWVIWVSLQCLIGLSYIFFIKHEKIKVLLYIGKSIFFSAYWFVLIYFFTLMIFLLLITFINRIYLLFIGCSLLYAINLYTNWFITNHTLAFFGYISYVFIGYKIYENYANVCKLLDKVPIGIIFIFVLFTYCLSIGEGYLLYYKLFSDDWLNTLRFSNQIYSILVFTFLLKLKNSWYPKSLNPRKNTFGVYLVHPILLISISFLYKTVISKIFMIDRHTISNIVLYETSIPVKISYLVVVFINVYGGSYFVIWCLKRLRLGFVVANT